MKNYRVLKMYLSGKHFITVYYKRVSAIFNGWLRGCAKDQYTDKDGEAHFSEDNGEGTIYVEGTTVYEGKIEGRKIIYI